MDGVIYLKLRERACLAPDRTQATRLAAVILLGAAWAAYTAILGYLYCCVPPSPDDSTYDYIGWNLCHGGRLYVDAADNNWPLICLLHAVSTWLFGPHIWSWHLFDYLFLLATCGVLFEFVRRHFGTLAGFVVVPVYQAMYVTQDHWFAGQRDLLAAPLVLGAAWAILERIERGWRWGPALSGILVALAGLMRPTFLILGPLLLLGDWILSRRSTRSWRLILRDHGVAILGAAAVLLVFGAWGAWTGGLAAWYEIAVCYNFSLHSSFRASTLEILDRGFIYVSQCWHWMIAYTLVGYGVCWRRFRGVCLVLGLIGLATVVSVLVQGRGMMYHWGPVYPLLALGMAPLLERALRNFRANVRRAARWELVQSGVWLAIPLLAAAGLGSKIWHGLGYQIRAAFSLAGSRSAPDPVMVENLSAPQVQSVARFVRESVKEDETVLCWGPEIAINYLSERRSPSRLAGFVMLDEPSDSWPGFADWRANFKRELLRSPPELILLIRQDHTSRYLFLPEEPREDRLGGIIRRMIRESYVLDRQIGQVDCYRRTARN
jgi:hypothetical protein